MRIDRTHNVLCKECFMSIETRDDLITAFRFFVVRPFHAGCYAKSIRGFRSLFVHNYPINGAMFMFCVVVSAIAGLFVAGLLSTSLMAFVSTGRAVSAAEIFTILFMVGCFFIPALIRYYSWARFEKELPE